MLERLILWLCRRFNINPVERNRLRMGDNAVQRGIRWQQFYDEDGGLADMIAILRREAFEAAQEAGAKDDQTRLAWMLQDRAYRQLDNKVRAVIASGKLAKDHAEEVARMDAYRVPRSV